MTHRKLEIKNIGGSPRCFGKIIFPYYLLLQSVTTKTGKIIFPDYLVLQSVTTKTWLHCSCSCCSPAWVRCPKSATKGQWNGVNWRERKRKEKMLAGWWNLTACSLQIVITRGTEGAGVRQTSRAADKSTKQLSGHTLCGHTLCQLVSHRGLCAANHPGAWANQNITNSIHLKKKKKKRERERKVF